MFGSAMKWLREPTPWGLSRRVLLVYLVLLANGVPAFVLLNLFSGHTRTLFVWTVLPPASAQLLGVMYGSALVLVLIGLSATSWPRTRIVTVLISYFALAATIVTLFTLGPFLHHPWTHLAYWLTMYILLVAFAPAVLVLEEREHGGRLPVDAPLKPATRAAGAIACACTGALGVALLIDPIGVGHIWLWPLTSLVGRILGVWFTSLALAYGWALRDGDWLRVRPIFWQGIPIGILFALVPLFHAGDVRPDPGARLLLYLGVAALLAGGGLVAAAAQNAVVRRAG
jgi:hypothetical protein